jgi:hypothetical protein
MAADMVGYRDEPAGGLGSRRTPGLLPAILQAGASKSASLGVVPTWWTYRDFPPLN